MAVINTKFPVNAMIFYSIIQSIASFDVLPSKDILYYFEFEENEPVFTENFYQFGYKNRNLVRNQGSIIVFIQGFIPLYFIYFLVFLGS